MIIFILLRAINKVKISKKKSTHVIEEENLFSYSQFPLSYHVEFIALDDSHISSDNFDDNV